MSKLATMTTAALQPLREIPREKRFYKVAKSIFGALVFVGAFFLPKYLGFPHSAAMVVAAFGGFCFSEDLVRKFVKIIPAAIGALKGTKPE